MKTFETLQKRINLVMTLVMAVVNERCAKISNSISFWGLDLALAGNNFVEKVVGEPSGRGGILKSLNRRFRFIGWAMHFSQRFEGEYTKYDFYHKLGIELAEQHLFRLSRLAAKKTTSPEMRHRTYLEMFKITHDPRDLVSVRQSIDEIGRDIGGEWYLSEANVYDRSEAYFETFLVSRDVKDLEMARMEALRQKGTQYKVWSLARIFAASDNQGDLEIARICYSEEDSAFARASAAIGLYAVTHSDRDIDFARLEATKVDFWLNKISALAALSVFSKERKDLWIVKSFCASITDPLDRSRAKKFLQARRRNKSSEYHRLSDLRTRIAVLNLPRL